MTTTETGPLDVWLRIREGEEESEAEANTYITTDGLYRVDWYLTAVGLVKSETFATLEEAQDWLKLNEFEDYSS